MFFMHIKINGLLNCFINVSSKIILSSSMGYVDQTLTRWEQAFALVMAGLLCPLSASHVADGQATQSLTMPGFLTGEWRCSHRSSQPCEDADEMVLVGKPGQQPTPGLPSLLSWMKLNGTTRVPMTMHVCMAPFIWRRQSWVVVPEMIQKPKIFTLWPFTETFANSWELLDHECKTRLLVHGKF